MVTKKSRKPARPPRRARAGARAPIAGGRADPGEGRILARRLRRDFARRPERRDRHEPAEPLRRLRDKRALYLKAYANYRAEVRETFRPIFLAEAPLRDKLRRILVAALDLYSSGQTGRAAVSRC